MAGKKALGDRIAGIISIVLGCVSIWQGVELYPYRQSRLMGDHVMLFILGAGLIILGVLVGFILRYSAIKVPETSKQIKRKVHLTFLTLFVFLFVTWLLGYVVGNFVLLFVLFRIYGAYSWPKCGLLSLLVTALIYFLFIYLVRTPFSNGIIFDMLGM